MKYKWIIIVAIVLLGTLANSLLKSLDFNLDNYFQDSITYVIVLAILGLIYEISKDFIKDYIKELFSKNKDEDDKRFENIEISGKKEINSALQQLRKSIEKRCFQYIDTIVNSEIKLIEKLNWQVKEYEGKYTFKSETLFDLMNIYKSKESHGTFIIGYPGVGKTSAIYSYINKLINENPKAKLPIYFPLALWVKDQPLVDWMESELFKIYGFKSKYFSYLIRKNKITPIFDALDQVSNELRNRCIQRIYDYSQNNPVIVTSRPKEFDKIEEYFIKKQKRLSEQFNIFELRPLKKVQVKSILNDIVNTDHIRLMAEANDNFSNIISYPMLLYIVVTIRDKIKVDDLSFIADQNILNVYEILWKKYDDYIFSKEGLESTVRIEDEKKIAFKKDETRHWLHRIANQKNNVIFIEDIQPEYLDKDSDKILYYFFSRIANSIFLTMGVGFFLAGPFEYIGAGIIGGCVITLVTLKFRGIYFKKIKISAKTDKVRLIKTVFIFYIISLIVLAIYFSLITPRKTKDMFYAFALTEANVGLFMALFFGVIFGLREYWYDKKDIKPVERISIDWKQFIFFGVAGGILLGFFLAICASLVVILFPNGTFTEWVNTIHIFTGTYVHQLTNGLIDIFVLGVLAGVAFGFPLIGALGILNQQKISAELEVKKQVSEPNYGIRQSLRNLLKGSFPAGLIMVLMYGAFFGLLTGDFTCYIKGMKSGLGGGIIVALWFGGFDVIQHFTLRVLIYYRGYGPWNYTKFMRFSTRLRFIKATGSSYEFIHDTLYSYFKTNYKDNKLFKGQAVFIVILLALIVVNIFISFDNRLDKAYFWQNRNGFKVEYIPSEFVKEASKLIALKSGNLLIKATGSINAGSFTGYVHPEGTKAGFLGVHIGSAYNVYKDSTDRHAALLVKSTRNKRWLYFHNNSSLINPFSDRVVDLKLNKGDAIEFDVNDAEHNNNSGYYTVNMKFINDQKLIIAHRGASSLAPENTLSAIRNAMLNNIKLIEFDIRQTKDNVLIVLHDDSVDRTTNGKGIVKDLTYAEIRKMRIKSSSGSIINDSIPLFSQVLELIKNSTSRLLIDVKDPNSSPGIENNIVNELNKVGMKNRVEIFSFNRDFLKKIKLIDSTIQTGLFALCPIDFKEIAGINVVGVHYMNLLLFPRFINNLQQKNYKVYLWTVNSSSFIDRSLNSSVDGIITDHPSRVDAQILSLKAKNYD